MRFADFHEGQRIEAGPHEVSQERILAFAREYDPQWFHVDPDAASKSPFEGLIASGWHTCAIAMRLAAEAALADSNRSEGFLDARHPAARLGR